VLTDDQQALLRLIVEASQKGSKRLFRAVPRGKTGEALVYHPSLQPGPALQALQDLFVLRDLGYLSVAKTQGSSFEFYVSPSGLQAHADLIGQDPAAAVEDSYTRYLDSEGFRKKYPSTYARWSKTSEVLRSPDAEGHLSEVGHYCREAMQEFAEELLAEHQLTPHDADKQRTVARIKQLLGAKKAVLGETVTAWLDAMLVYWGTVADLSQRQEHAAQKDGEQLKWDDARRLVFQSISLMYEMSEALAPYKEDAVKAQIDEDRAWLTEQDARPEGFIPEEVSRERRMRETRLDGNLKWLNEAGLEDGWA
jgi:hypothetical protein